MIDIKVKIYGETNFELPTKSINNLYDINFTEDINAGQGGIDIVTKDKYTTKKYKPGDMLEISIYSENFKTGKLIYSGIISKRKRFYDTTEQGIVLECESIVSLLSQKVNKSFSGTYSSIVDDIIGELQNSCQMDFLGETIFKNSIQSNETTSVSINGTLLSGLQKLFSGREFFINQYGEIKDTFTNKHFIKSGVDINEFTASESTNGIEEVEMDINTNFDISCGDKIKIVNTDDEINLDNKQITKLDFGLQSTKIIIGKITQISTK